MKLPSGFTTASILTEVPTVGRLPPKAERSVWAEMAIVYVCPLGALMTRRLLVILFTGPMKEMPPALNATGAAVGAGGCVAVGGTCVAVLVVAVVLVVGCPGLLATPEHPAIKIMRPRTTVHTSIPRKRGNGMVDIVFSLHLT